MNPQNLGFGSGSPMIGQGGQVAQQMEQGAPAMNQQGTSSPGFTPDQTVNPYPPLQGSTNPMSILPQGAGAPPQGANPPGMAKPTVPKSEAHLIIEALSNRLKSMSDLEHKLHDSLFPQPQEEGGVK